MKKSISAALFLMMTACGGGGGSNPSPQATITDMSGQSAVNALFEDLKADYDKLDAAIPRREIATSADFPQGQPIHDDLSPGQRGLVPERFWLHESLAEYAQQHAWRITRPAATDYQILAKAWNVLRLALANEAIQQELDDHIKSLASPDAEPVRACLGGGSVTRMTGNRYRFTACAPKDFPGVMANGVLFEHPTEDDRGEFFRTVGKDQPFQVTGTLLGSHFDFQIVEAKKVGGAPVKIDELGTLREAKVLQKTSDGRTLELDIHELGVRALFPGMAPGKITIHHFRAEVHEPGDILPTMLWNEGAGMVWDDRHGLYLGTLETATYATEPYYVVHADGSIKVSDERDVTQFYWADPPMQSALQRYR